MHFLAQARLTKLCQHIFFAEKASLLEASRHHHEKGSKSSNSQNSNNMSRKTAQNKSEHVTTAQSQQHPRTIKITSRNPTSATKTQKTRQTDSSTGFMQQQQQRRTLSFNETSVLIAFILVILTLLIITMAMFKLAGSIGALSERLYTLEDRLAQYSKECQFVNVNQGRQ